MSKYCVKCGAETTQTEKIKCEECGVMLPKDTKFCNSCGASLKKTQKTFCQFCGEKYEGNSTFCKKCGHKISKTDNLFGGFSNFGAATNGTKIETFVKKLSDSKTILQIIAIGIVLLMFIFAVLPVFTFKVDKSSGKFNKTEIRNLEELSEDLNEKVSINLFQPMAVFDDYDYELDTLSDSGIKQIAKLGDTLKEAYVFGVIGAIIQAIAYILIMAIFILPLVKQIEIKILDIAPMIFSACALIYSIVVLILINSGLDKLQSVLGAVGAAGIKLSFGVIGWFYLVFAVALFVVSFLIYKSKNRVNA